MSSINLLFEPHVGSVARRDMLIEFIKAELYHGFALGLSEAYAPTMKRIEVLIEEHRALASENPLAISRLKNAVPSVSSFHTPLPLEEAWRRYDNKYCVSARRTVAPSFNEVRHTLNLAQVMALAPHIEMACFDGDQTLYSDGGNFTNTELASVLIMLMENKVKVVLITAAGYGFDGSKYEIRVRGLLDAMVMAELSEEAMGRFYVMGGECNYLLRCDASGHLVKVSDAEWEAAESRSSSGKVAAPRHWPEEECSALLDVAEASLRSSMSDLKLRAALLRKARGVGIIPGGKAAMEAVLTGHGHDKIKAEALDEVVHRARAALVASGTQLPFCAFNGGRDAWVDVGNKRIGVEAMQIFLGLPPHKCLHVGDQFLKTGNDVAAREASPCIWIISPKETLKVLEILLSLMGLAEATDGPGVDVGFSPLIRPHRTPMPRAELAMPALDI